MSDVYPCGPERFFIDGPAGRLEALGGCPEPERAAAASAVVCHPHPLHGGTMQNKVVHILARTLNELGLHTLRFNFRGVGQSEGEFADAVGETDDVLAALEWLRSRRPDDALWLAGFSFGAFVAIRAALRFPVARLVTVAPAITLYPELATLDAPAAPWLIVQGDRDEIVPVSAVEAWIERLAPRPDYLKLPDTGHFFHQRLTDLHDRLADRLAPHVPRR
ncbi:alpha/beta hydrolase [Sulfurifustis variabilis]|uniref:Alpha/beta hydrolase n=1 Tax=Sulfurifustis variabilis TaxID=1675686 RepID=A0A1B4UZV5_9GAMM|nr:alpha/beta fold hydrolase [Sulfurifustis variabilis]BAU46686.1 alpha/beta hydrolase [Sulfurifustis variabilis]